MHGTSIAFGVFSGIAGGTVFILLMGMMGVLPPAGELIGRPTALASFLLHMLTSAFIGGSFAALCGRVTRIGRGARYGLLYAAAWWILGPVTLVPLLLGEGIGTHWKGLALIRLLPSLFGVVTSGAVLGATYAWLWATTAGERVAGRAPAPRAGNGRPGRAGRAPERNRR